MTKIVSGIVLMVICLAAVYHTGKRAGENEVKAAYADTLQETQRSLEEARGRNKELFSQLQYKILNPGIKYVEVTEYVPQIQRSDGECNLTLGTVSMLNERLGHVPGSEHNPEWPADRRATASTVTESALIEHDARLYGRCETLRQRWNVLVQAVKNARSHE